MNWEAIVTSTFCSRLCLSLLHSFWLIVLLAVAARAADFVLRRRSVESRYAVYVTTMIGCLVTLPLTFAMVDVPAVAPAVQAIDQHGQAFPNASVDELVYPEAGGAADNKFRSQPPRAAGSQTAVSLPTSDGTTDSEPASIDWVLTWHRWSPWIVGLYGLGVFAMFARLVRGTWTAHRLRVRAETIHEGPLVDLLRTIATGWSMRVVPTLARAEQIAVPIVVGLARPTILLPASALSGLSIAELEMILAHELAHVRRYDMWVNLLQRVAETVFFFNPAMWYTSRRISTLREYCCDEMVCQAIAKTRPQPQASYASALLRVAELYRENDSVPTTDSERSELAALAASGRSPSELRRRVAHLFGEPLREPLRLTRGSAVTLLALLIVLLVSPFAWFSLAESSDPVAHTEAPVESLDPTPSSNGWGSVSGQFILDGDNPEKQDDALIVSSESKGIANIFVYLVKTAKIHPDLVKNRRAEIAFAYQRPHFKPRALFVQTEQTILIKNSSQRVSNVHTFPRRNPHSNTILPPGNGAGLRLNLRLPEFQPFKVGNDLNADATAYWLVLDHPYAAVSDKNGRFHIGKLPAGDHEFRVWHEKAGYIDRKFRVSVEADKSTEIDPTTISIARFVPPVSAGSTVITGICHDGDEEPIASADVSLYLYDYEADTTRRLGQTRSDKEGRFQFPRARSDKEGRFQFPPGSAIELPTRHSKYYYITASANGRASVIQPVLTGFGAPHRIKLPMPPAATVRGRLMDIEGNSITGADVWTAGFPWRPTRGLASATTDEKGRFAIVDLGKWNGETQRKSGSLKVRHPLFGRRWVNYTNAPNIDDVVLQPPAVIEGRVVYGGSNEPATGVWVQAQNIDMRPLGEERVRTDSQGRYRLLLPESAYNVWARLDRWTVMALDSFEGKAGETRRAPDLKLIKGGFVTGRLVDADNGKATGLSKDENVSIGLYGPSRPRSGAAVESTKVERDGTFRIRVAPGSNYVYVMGRGPFEIIGPVNARSRTSDRQDIAHEIDVKESETATVEFQVRRASDRNIGKEEILQLERLKPEVAASIVREVYRDLLDPNGRSEKGQPRFSVAVDAKTNSIRIKSSHVQLREDILDMLRKLDRAAPAHWVDREDATAKDDDTSENNETTGKPDKDTAVHIKVIIARHVLLLEGREIITWTQLDEKIAALPDPSLVLPHYYVTHGAHEAGREPETRENIVRIRRTYKINRLSRGILGPRADSRYDRIKTAADIVPDEALRMDGKVVDQHGEPVMGAEVLLVTPVDESISYKSYHIALVQGRVRNSLRHVMTRSDDAGEFVFHPPRDEAYYIIALHPDAGFALTADDQFAKAHQVRLSAWAGLISGFSKEPEDQRASLRTRVPESDGRPEVVVNQYWSDLKKQEPTLVFRFTHVPPIYNTTISRDLPQKDGGSIGISGTSVGLLPGETRRVDLGPLSKQQRQQLNRTRRDSEIRREDAKPDKQSARDNGGQTRVAGKPGNSNAAAQNARAETDSESEASAQVTFPITVTGHAVDETGNPIAGATVYLAASHPNSNRLAVTETDRNGAYRFEKVPLPIEQADTNKGRDVGTFQVFGEMDGYGFAWRAFKSFYPGSEHEKDRPSLPTKFGRLDPIDLDLAFGKEAKLRGRIVDDKGQPIADTELAIRRCKPEWNPNGFNKAGADRDEFALLNERALVPPRIKVRHTDSDGRFEFDKLPNNCRFWIKVRPPGHTPRNIWAVTSERIREDTEGNRVYSGDFEVVFATPRTVKLRVVYGDTGKPAPRVGVGGLVSEASFWETTDEDGFVKVPLPDGRYQLGVTPRYRTPYLRRKFEVVVSAETAEKTTTVKLRPAAVIDITVRDADTGKPLAGLDVWVEEDNRGGGNQHRRVHGYRSWEVETRISRYESPRSDKNGKMRVQFEPGAHRIGVGLEAYPEGYEPVQPDGRKIECQPGQAVAVEFQMKKIVAVSQSTKKFELLVQGPDGLPVPGANVEIRTKPFPTAEQIIVGKFIKASAYGPFVQTNAEGRLVVQIPMKPTRFNLSIKQPGYGPYWAGWSSNSDPQAIPHRFTAKLDAGWSVGGVVVDSSGQPIEGVEVHPSVEFKKRPGDTGQLGVGTRIVTDSKGQWQFDHVPVSKSDVHVAFDHPDYGPSRIRLPRDGFEVKRDTPPRGRTELKRGLTVTGTVTDESGKPIDAALVRTKFQNETREARTDKRGVYRLVGCEPRMARIVVSAKGRATDMQEIRVDRDMSPVNFSMKPGGKIRIRVVDEQGNGIAKARILFQRWRGMFHYFEFKHVSQYADENGVWEWNEAPLDEFKADICRPGGMQLSTQSLIAREEEYVFTPPRALVVSGSVVDAKTKAPIKKFRVIPGLRNRNSRIRMSWITSDSYDATDGKYRIRLTHDYIAHLVRIEAEGYKVAISRDIKTDEGEVDFDFELHPAEDIAATILTAAGKPAAHATIALGVAGSQISIQNGDIDDGSTYATTLDAAADGRFNISARDEPFQLVITHSSGFAYLKSADGPIPGRITLKPWARAEGTFRVGAQPASNVVLEMFADAIHSYGDDAPHVSTDYEVTTGKDGRFVFERVFPGRGRIGRHILLMADEGATEVTSSQRVSAEFIAGETTTLDLGGTGRPVVGTLAPPAEHSEKVFWNFALVIVQADLKQPPAPTAPDDVRDNPKKRKAWWEAWKATDTGRAWTSAYEAYQRLKSKSPYITATVDRDGSFRIDDVPEGNYVLKVRFSKNAVGSLIGYRFSVPSVEEGRAGERLELGTLTLGKQ